MLGHRHPNVNDKRRIPFELIGDMDLKPRPEMEALEVEAFHYTLGLGETGDHGLWLIGEGSDVEVSVE